MESTALSTNLYGIDIYDTISPFVVQRIKYDGAYSLIETISPFEFDSRIFAGVAVNPEQGSIVTPTRTIKYFPQTNSLHVINTHSSNNVTSVKRAIRAVMPSNFITEPHWVLLYVRGEYFNADGTVTLENYYVSTIVSSSVDVTYLAFTELLKGITTVKYGDNSSHYIQELSVVIRREI